MSSPPFPETESRVSERINLFAEDVNEKQDAYVVKDDETTMRKWCTDRVDDIIPLRLDYGYVQREKREASPASEQL